MHKKMLNEYLETKFTTKIQPFPGHFLDLYLMSHSADIHFQSQTKGSTILEELGKDSYDLCEGL